MTSERELQRREQGRHFISRMAFPMRWNPEHGFAVITHQERVIDLDRGETDIWKIYEDNGTLEEVQKEYNERAKNFKPREVKPWWKIW